jgi:hypothetical protein
MSVDSCVYRKTWRTLMRMTFRDIFDDLGKIAYPTPERDTVNPPEAYDDALDDTLRRRKDYVDNLRAAWDAEDVDPLLTALTAARGEMNRAEHHLRQLLAYGRECVQPRPYRLEDLAGAAGMSISGVRTAYDDRTIAEVVEYTGAKPRESA